MLFLVISEPRPEPPGAMAARRQDYWRWIDDLVAAGQVIPSPMDQNLCGLTKLLVWVKRFWVKR